MIIQYDAEDLMLEVVDLMQTKLNDKITQIENLKIAKGQGLGLETIPTDRYSIQNISDNWIKEPVWVLIGFDTITTVDGGGAALDTHRIQIEVVNYDPGTDANGWRKLHRYTRAIKEVVLENFDALSFGNQTKIETIRPTAFSIDQNTSEEMRVGGISLSTSFA